MWLRRARVLTAACGLAGVVGVSPGYAEPITAGGLTVAGRQGTVDLASPSGFTLTAMVDAAIGLFQPWNMCVPCRPGSLLEPDAAWVGSDLRVLTVNGQPVPFDTAAEVRFEGAGVVPLLDASAVTELLQTNVALSGFVGPIGQRTFLTGTGVAFITLGRIPGTGLWMFRSAEYRLDAGPEIDPVPEPGTMVLFGTGVVSLWFRRRSRATRTGHADR
ncbi:MAG: PEP-CTERM sorting domain-containing protein [Acidobacteria bacterium]|nr:PEP-CTERM sorting domain-containing protein [Acidobacteriota bacterium]